MGPIYFIDYATYDKQANRLDYCNSVFAGISGQLLHKLQMIQNAAARLITGTKKFEHSSSQFCKICTGCQSDTEDRKTAMFVFKCT